MQASVWGGRSPIQCNLYNHCLHSGASLKLLGVAMGDRVNGAIGSIE
ncbi:hypothetical protein QUA67_11220 [Microcoleus sp. M2_C5]